MVGFAIRRSPLLFISGKYFIFAHYQKNIRYDTGREKETGQTQKRKAGHLILLFSYNQSFINHLYHRLS